MKSIYLSIIFSLYLLLSPDGSLAQSIGNQSLKLEKRSTTTGQLARAITKNATTHEEKAWAIFNWIVRTIDYDHELSASRKLQQRIYTSENSIIKNALERKKALCGGYAFLFQELCAQVGISSEVIHGYTKQYAAQTKREKVNHTWNAVKLNDQWYLLDITWAKSHGSSSEPDTFWYRTPPKDFIYTHYPEDTKWTLLRHPISKKEFETLPSH
ncbi:transglutaminase domain-containing protein [Altibacter sp.]|uniref:transglutaminase domain-containing protein n=1 Tax=Altibacter sp. TaxID=2024823 RepID=UPI000C8B0D9D|nr:transglutaminase domain-containing protein [Altibacter sp.]MAP53637.1 hypothetical protein [Altibacter sp.]